MFPISLAFESIMGRFVVRAYSLRRRMQAESLHHNPRLHLWLLMALAVSGCAASSPAQDQSAQGGPALAAALPADDGGGTYWPIALDAPEGRVEVYQPQPEAMTGDT